VAEASSNWESWRLAVFGDPYLVWHEGPDFDKVLTEWEEDPRRVLHMLCLGLAEEDPLAAQTATFLMRRGHALDGVEGQLRDSLYRASGTFRVRVAEALFAFTRDGALAESVCAVLASAPSWGERMDAAIALNAFPSSPSVVAALAGGVEDEEYLVRRHSAQTMLTLAGMHTSIEETPALWNLIKPDNSRRSWQKAARRLSALLSQQADSARPHLPRT
jgi:hypothetical protein